MKSVLNLLSSLTKATEAGKLAWTRIREDTVTASLPNGYNITVWKWTDENTGLPLVGLKLVDREGALIDAEEADQFVPTYFDLLNFFSLARRSANDVTSVIEHLEQDILNLT